MSYYSHVIFRSCESDSNNDNTEVTYGLTSGATQSYFFPTIQSVGTNIYSLKESSIATPYDSYNEYSVSTETYRDWYKFDYSWLSSSLGTTTGTIPSMSFKFSCFYEKGTAPRMFNNGFIKAKIYRQTTSGTLSYIDETEEVSFVFGTWQTLYASIGGFVSYPNNKLYIEFYGKNDAIRL